MKPANENAKEDPALLKSDKASSSIVLTAENTALASCIGPRFLGSDTSIRARLKDLTN